MDNYQELDGLEFKILVNMDHVGIPLLQETFMIFILTSDIAIAMGKLIFKAAG